MLYDHKSALAPTPADPNAASTGDEADPRDKVSTAMAEMLSVAHDPPPHAHEQACNPSGYSSSNLPSEPAAYSTSDPMGRALILSLYDTKKIFVDPDGKIFHFTNRLKIAGEEDCSTQSGDWVKLYP